MGKILSALATEYGEKWKIDIFYLLCELNASWNHAIMGKLWLSTGTNHENAFVTLHYA